MYAIKRIIAINATYWQFAATAMAWCNYLVWNDKLT
jgi:hypothetical protein